MIDNYFKYYRPRSDESPEIILFEPFDSSDIDSITDAWMTMKRLLGKKWGSSLGRMSVYRPLLLSGPWNNIRVVGEWPKEEDWVL